MHCQDKCRCTCTEKPNPAECTPEQIRECHGGVKGHECEKRETRKK